MTCLYSDDQLALINPLELESSIHQLLEQSNERIWVAHYIVANTPSGKRFMAHLIQKSLEGVDVKLIMDGLGPGPRFPWKLKELRLFEAAGIELKIFNPKFRRLFKLNRRMHDKIILCDDEVIIGSSSIWEMSFRAYLSETDILLKGPVVGDIEKHYQALWGSKSCLKPFYWFVKKAKKSSVKEYIQKYFYLGKEDKLHDYQKFASIDYVHDDVPKSKSSRSFNTVLNKLEGAVQSIEMVNPYLFPVKELEDGLRRLQKKGIEIKIYTNSVRSLAGEFTILGIKYAQYFELFKDLKIEIWELKKDSHTLMVHDKFILIDDMLMYIGSLNLDRLGAYFNTENGVWVKMDVEAKQEDPPLLENLKHRIERIKKQSQLAFKNGQQFANKETGQSRIKNILSKCLLPLIGKCF